MYGLCCRTKDAVKTLLHKKEGFHGIFYSIEKYSIE